MKKISELFSQQGLGTHLLTAFIAAFIWHAPQTAQAEDLGDIMPMGDSITLGVPIAGGYRDPLYTLLNNQGDNFTFVGSSTSYETTTLTTAGQAHHEGPSGFVITNAVSISRTGLDEYLTNWIGPSGEDPDKILLMIGSNDINLGYDMTNAPTRLHDLITHIYENRPDVKLYLASIIPMVGHESDVQAFNATIPGIVASHRTLGQNIVYVPMYEALDINTDLNDGLHPNAAGYQKMAAAWDTALHTSNTHAVDVTSAGSGPALGSSFNVGWDFTVTEAIVIKSLGQFDPDSTPTNNTVAIYERGGAKLVEAALFTNSTAELSGIYSARYVPVSDTLLAPGDYVVFSTQNGNNFISSDANPDATFGSAITWNMGVAQGAANPLPTSAPASWQIENTNTYRYFGPTFTYNIAPPPDAPALTLDSPTGNQSFMVGTAISASATVTESTGAYTVHIYTNSSSGSFAEAGTGSSSTPHQVSLGTLPIGTYHIFASVTDTLATTITTTNTFTVSAAPLPGQQILSLSGWNQDLIIGATEAALEYSTSMSGWNFYESGLSGSSQGLAADSGGSPRTFTSSYNPSVQFQFSPYDGNNAVYLNGIGNATLTLTYPTTFHSLQFLMTARSISWYAKLNFADGSSTTTPTWSDPDWTSSGPTDKCLSSYGLKSTSGSFYTGSLWMAERGFTLSSSDQLKTLQSITFYNTTSGNQQLALFAVSGYVIDSPTDTFDAAEVMSDGTGASGGSTYDVGWDFTISQTIRVTSLGQFDPDLNPKSNSVAIYQRAGDKLIEATVLSTSPAEQSGNYTARYVPVDNLVLTPGDYVVFSTQNGNNYIAGGGAPEAAFGPAIKWNKGVAQSTGSLPESAPASWLVNNTTTLTYFGPTFKYELVVPPPTLTITSPTNNQALVCSEYITADITVVNAYKDFTAHLYIDNGTGTFAEVGTDGSNTPYQVSLGKLPAGTYQIFASVTDTLTTVTTTTNTFTVAVTSGQQIVDLTGWNEDIIIGATETAPGYSISTTWHFYEEGLSGGTQGLATASSATPRTFTSSYNSNVDFQFAPYTGNNAIYLSGPGNGTLTLINPAKFYSLQFLMTARTMSWYARLNFADGSSTTTPTWDDNADWIQTGPADTCLTAYGLKNTNGSFYSDYIWMAERGYILTTEDQKKTVESITFYTTSSGDKQLMLFAVSGYAINSSLDIIHAVDIMSDGDGAGSGTTYSVGWEFTVNQAITLTSLGQFDPDSNPTSNTVAIYQQSGNKLAQATVLATIPAEQSGNYPARYVPIDEMVLPPGDYVIFSTQNGNKFIAGGGTPEATIGPAITWTMGVALGSGSAAGPVPETAPTSWPINNPGKWRYFGPTFKYKLEGVVPPDGLIIIIR
jgi:lysophospholipase L1-like esterase